MRIASHKYWLKKTWNHFCKRKLKAKPRRLRHCWKMNANDVVVVKCLRRIFRIVVGARRTYPPFTRSAFLAVQICTLRSDRPLKRSAKSAHLLSYHVRTLSVAARAYFPLNLSSQTTLHVLSYLLNYPSVTNTCSKILFSAVRVWRQIQGQIWQQHHSGPEVLPVLQWIRCTWS